MPGNPPRTHISRCLSVHAQHFDQHLVALIEGSGTSVNRSTSGPPCSLRRRLSCCQLNDDSCGPLVVLGLIAQRKPMLSRMVVLLIVRQRDRF